MHAVQIDGEAGHNVQFEILQGIRSHPPVVTFKLYPCWHIVHAEPLAVQFVQFGKAVEQAVHDVPER